MLTHTLYKESLASSTSHAYRAGSPFNANVTRNWLKIQHKTTSIAAKAGCTPAQLALRWLLHKDANIIPIPGTTSLKHLEDNLRVAQIQFDVALLNEAEACIGSNAVSGARYSPETQMEIDTEES